MRNKLSIQHGEEGDEEDSEVDVTDKDKQWGKSKKGYYGADTEEYEARVLILLNCQCPAWQNEYCSSGYCFAPQCQANMCCARQDTSTCEY